MSAFTLDSGSYKMHMVLSGDYTVDATKKIITFGAGGQGDTGIILPTKDHVIVETYNIDGVSGAVDINFFKRDVADVDAYLAECQALVEAEVTAGRYTAYKMKATRYKGNDKADTYDADESTFFPMTANNIDVDYTPSAETWKVSNTLTAPSGEVVLYEMGSTFIGGTTTPYSTSWIPDITKDFKIVMGITMHSSVANPATEECGCKKTGTDDNARIGMGLYNGNAWFRCGGEYYNSGTTLSASTSYVLELQWIASTSTATFIVNGDTKETTSSVDLDTLNDIPMHIGGRMTDSTLDREIASYDITSYKATEM